MNKKRINLNQLVGQLFNTPVPPMPEGSSDKDAKPTTIRPNARTAHFFAYHAERLGLSMQDVIALTMNAIVFETESPARTELQLAVDRFKHIFEAHRIPQIHAKHIIDSFQQNNFPLGCMTNDKMLLEQYKPTVKEALSQIFGVRTDWLSGTGNRAIVADPIYSRDYAYSVWHRVNHPVNLKGITVSDRRLLFVKSDADICLDTDGKNLPIEVLLFSLVEYSVDKWVHFKTYHLNGIFPLANIEARICLQALLSSAQDAATGELGISGVAYGQDVITGIKLGLLPADCFGDGFPTLWDPESLLEEGNPEADMASKLLCTSK